ncbi:MAG: rhodanese-like domain-containing protein, partial [Cyanobacteriota bacterium]|nr:rhodanese-like domain-containing protein [Cyanobacteriota bacterium]
MTVSNPVQLQEIDARTLKQWLEENSAKLVDVREPSEYAAERIPGAQLHPLS